MKWSELIIVPLLAITILAIASYHYLFLNDDELKLPSRLVSEQIPDFKSYSDVKAKKLDFFSYMLPMVRSANSTVSSDRAFLEQIVAKESRSTQEEERLTDLLSLYKLSGPSQQEDPVTRQQLQQLLQRIDIVPASLILAQSANESAWGTSRFATDANNFFGLWCFKKGCGLTPRDRDEGLVHEVASFRHVQDGVDYYIHTINTHAAYKTLRDIRAGHREKIKELDGSEMAEGLVRYSERGMAYVQEIQAMIRFNNLEQYNLQTGPSNQSAE